MEKNPPGIFNDVLGPVMRGPSSSHTAGSHRIGAVIRQFAGPNLKKVDFHFHTEGSLATTYHTQGSDIGLGAGLLGMDITDPDIPDSLNIARSKGLEINFILSDYDAAHPNTYLCEIENHEGQVFKLTAISTGGGIIEIIGFQGFQCSILMDLPTLLITGRTISVEKCRENIRINNKNRSEILRHSLESKEDSSLLCIEFNISDPEIITDYPDDIFARLVKPVYPSLGYTGSLLPFRKAEELEADKELDRKDFAKLAIEYESKRSGLNPEEITKRIADLLDIFMEAIETGLSGTNYRDRLAHAQSPAFLESLNLGKLLPGGPLNKMTAYTMAIMESKSAMEVIVAAPTAGSAGGLPGALIGMAEEIEAGREDLIRAFLAAGLAGVFIAADATFAAEVAGCQAETGAGAAMAAAGLIQLAGGNAKQAMDAASIALQNVMGLVCDPIANRVEIPCLGRNIQAGANAFISANMVLGGVDAVVPFSESIKTMLDVGKALPRELRCTALGGLSLTKTAQELEKRLKKF